LRHPLTVCVSAHRRGVGWEPELGTATGPAGHEIVPHRCGFCTRCSGSGLAGLAARLSGACSSPSSSLACLAAHRSEACAVTSDVACLAAHRSEACAVNSDMACLAAHRSEACAVNSDLACLAAHRSEVTPPVWLALRRTFPKLCRQLGLCEPCGSRLPSGNSGLARLAARRSGVCASAWRPTRLAAGQFEACPDSPGPTGLAARRSGRHGLAAIVLAWPTLRSARPGLAAVPHGDRNCQPGGGQRRLPGFDGRTRRQSKQKWTQSLMPRYLSIRGLLAAPLERRRPCGRDCSDRSTGSMSLLRARRPADMNGTVHAALLRTGGRRRTCGLPLPKKARPLAAVRRAACEHRMVDDGA